MMKPSLGKVWKFEQSPWTPSNCWSCATSSEGPASCEVPVSTATRQSLQMLRGCPLKAMSSIRTSQYPLLPETGTQKSSEAMCSSLTSPKVISEASASESERKTENTGFFNKSSLERRLIMLKACDCDIEGSARPRTPSKPKEANGDEDSSVEAMKFPMEQALPTQIRSSRQPPVMRPVPKVMVIWSGELLAATSLPSQLMDLVLEDFFSLKRSCIWQAELAQSGPGTMRLPLPVSKTTVNTCAGVPTPMSP
mmetsp:Transcript_101074/g.268716  ORF Transcript_101074/g.268716 Transcript_101074/m.268716 type:complete len:252 (-) Transcript_101074:198-953(-)